MYRKLFLLICASFSSLLIVNATSIILFNYSHKTEILKIPEISKNQEIKQEEKSLTLNSSTQENTPIVLLEKELEQPTVLAENSVEIPTDEDQSTLWDAEDFSIGEELSADPSTDLLTYHQPSWEESDAEESPLLAPIRAGLRYTTPKGIGYNSGYTTLSGFFAPKECLKGAFIPFLDLRAHLFTNGRWAANGGIGLRYLSRNHVFGTNLYYDFRNASKINNCNQIALGFESLGKIFDVRLNGYLPVGHRKSGLSGYSFSHFHNHSLILKANQKTALKGANLEIGGHVNHFRKTPLYFAAGPYYLNGGGKSSFGGEARASIDLLNQTVRLEGNSSYDTLFKWRGQAQLSVHIPLNKNKYYVRQKTCEQSMTLHERALQAVERHEIIPISHSANIVAINPATGMPWVFWFVDNTSSSAGTFEDPYHTLLDAQNASLANQAIYVFSGDGTTAGMNAGITLKDGQLFLGSGTAHPIVTTKGTVTVPELTTNSPNITNVGDTVTLANSNTVSGFNMTINSNGIFGSSISNLIATHNNFLPLAANVNGIKLTNPAGDVVINNSQFNNFQYTGPGSNGNGIYLIAGVPLNSLDVSNNLFNVFSGVDASAGNWIYLSLDGGELNKGLISENIFNSTLNASAIGITSSGSQLGFFNELNISANEFQDITSGMAIDFLILNSAGGLNQFIVQNNNFSSLLSSSALNSYIFTNPAVYSRFIIENNNVQGSSFGFITNANSSNALFKINNNNFQDIGAFPVGITAPFTGTPGTICLDFVNNRASPSSPYQFSQFSPNIFNTTGPLDSTTNTGAFSLSGTINIGACSD